MKRIHDYLALLWWVNFGQIELRMALITAMLGEDSRGRENGWRIRPCVGQTWGSSIRIDAGIKRLWFNDRMGSTRIVVMDLPQQGRDLAEWIEGQNGARDASAD